MLLDPHVAEHVGRRTASGGSAVGDGSESLGLDGDAVDESEDDDHHGRDCDRAATTCERRLATRFMAPPPVSGKLAQRPPARGKPCSANRSIARSIGNLHDPLLLVDPFVAAECFVFVVTKLSQIGTGLGSEAAARAVV